jgi:hypothetical protein
MPLDHLTERERLVLDLALEIEDPAGVEAIELAHVILEVFGDREPRQADLMRESLHRWSMQWPRALSGRNEDISSKG